MFYFCFSFLPLLLLLLLLLFYLCSMDVSVWNKLDWLIDWFQHWIATKWLEIDQDKLRMKFSAFNVDFSCPSFDPLGSRRPAQAGVKDSYPPKKWLFYHNFLANSVKMVADRYIHAAYHNKHWWQAFWIYQHRWPWTTLNPKNIDFKRFFNDFWLQTSELRRNGWR